MTYLIAAGCMKGGMPGMARFMLMLMPGVGGIMPRGKGRGGLSPMLRVLESAITACLAGHETMAPQ